MQGPEFKIQYCQRCILLILVCRVYFSLVVDTELDKIPFLAYDFVLLLYPDDVIIATFPSSLPLSSLPPFFPPSLPFSQH
jgi:hypothetical protein